MLDGGNVLNNKVSTHIDAQLPEFIQADHPLFSKFVKAYYQFLESAEITFSEVNSYVRQETQSVNFLLDENGDQIVLEKELGSTVKFEVGEILTGQTSGATATVLVDDVDDNKRLFVTSQNQFILGENVSSNRTESSGTILTYRPNPVSSIQQLLNYSNVDSTIFKFLDNFRDAFLEGVVDNLADGVDKRKLIKNVRDLYISKGTRKGHELFFRLLLNEEPIIEYPTDQMLRVSDGRWSVRDIMRAKPVNGSASELVGQTITGQTSGATAIVVSSVSFRESQKDVVELELDPSTITGTFIENENVFGISTVTDQTVSFQPYSIIIGTTVLSGGAYYTADQIVNISATGSQTATAKVQTVSRGLVDEIVIDDAGQNYKVGDNLTLDNSNTDGTGAAAEVSVVGGGIAPEIGSVEEYGMEEDDHITLEETSQPFYNDNYEGVKIVLETGTFANLSVASEAGEITDVRMISRGAGYSKLPVVTGITTANGSGAKLLAASNSGIGAINSIEFINQGIEYSTAPIITPLRHAIIKDITGTFGSGDTIEIPNAQEISLEDDTGRIDLESATGTGLLLTEETLSGSVTAFDSSRQLISINTTANLEVNDTITVGGSKSGTVANISVADATGQVGQIAKTAGNFLTSAGQVSDVNIRVQDSFYYQDYSYVVRVGESINLWRDAIKSTVHPAGWAVFGQVDIVGRPINNARISPQTVESFTPELASELKGIFSTVFGRRLGTIDDGTSLKATPQVGSDDLTSFPNTNRDLTLERINTIFVGVARTPSAQGSTLDLLPKYAFSIGATTSESIPNYPGLIRTRNLDDINDQSFTIGQFANIRINQVDDGTGKIPDAAFNTSINVPPPGEIQISGTARANAFDNNFITFDSSTETFDESVLTTNFSSASLKFDSSSIKFDGSGGVSVPRDVAGLYNIDFSDTTTSFDSSINKFDTSHNPLVFERFSSSNFNFDSTTKTFDIGA
tara:strand:- start:2308 stop:5220 length:2913 start_codon:yes stop_codon:yes gene_type:complete